MQMYIIKLLLASIYTVKNIGTLIVHFTVSSIASLIKAEISIIDIKITLRKYFSESVSTTKVVYQIVLKY